jgi:hypothetical protein
MDLKNLFEDFYLFIYADHPAINLASYNCKLTDSSLAFVNDLTFIFTFFLLFSSLILFLIHLFPFIFLISTFHFLILVIQFCFINLLHFIFFD